MRKKGIILDLANVFLFLFAGCFSENIEKAHAERDGYIKSVFPDSEIVEHEELGALIYTVDGRIFRAEYVSGRCCSTYRFVEIPACYK